MKRSDRLPIFCIIVIELLSVGNSSFEENLMEAIDLYAQPSFGTEGLENSGTIW